MDIMDESLSIGYEFCLKEIIRYTKKNCTSAVDMGGWQRKPKATNRNSHHFRTLSGHNTCVSAYSLVGLSSATAQRSEIRMIRY